MGVREGNGHKSTACRNLHVGEERKGGKRGLVHLSICIHMNMDEEGKEKRVGLFIFQHLYIRMNMEAQTRTDVVGELAEEGHRLEGHALRLSRID